MRAPLRPTWGKEHVRGRWPPSGWQWRQALRLWKDPSCQPTTLGFCRWRQHRRGNTDRPTNAQKWTVSPLPWIILCPVWVSHPKSVCQHPLWQPSRMWRHSEVAGGVTYLPGSPPGTDLDHRPRQPRGLRSGVPWGIWSMPSWDRRVGEFPEEKKWGPGPLQAGTGLGWGCRTRMAQLALVGTRHPRKT